MKFSPFYLLSATILMSLSALTVMANTSHLSIFKQQIICDTIPPKDTTGLKRVEKEAYFIGGEKAWLQFLSENINSKVPVKKKAPAGMYNVIIEFVVDVDGSISYINPLTNYGYGMEEEVMRVIKKSPLWVPAVQDDKKVKVYRKQPLTFKIEGKEKK